MWRLFLTTTLLWLSIPVIASAVEEPSPLPDASQVKTVSIKFDHPKLKDDVEFAATPEDWKAIRATMLPGKVDQKPKKWEWLGTVNIVKRDKEPFRVELYYVAGDKPGAFAAGKTFEQRVYYRGGKTAELVKAIQAAYEKSKKRKE